MKNFYKIFGLFSIFFLLSAFSLYAADVSLEVIQQFKENAAGNGNQVKFADVNGDGADDMIARYSDDGWVVGIWLYDNASQKFSDSVDCKIDLNFILNTCWFNVGDLNMDGIADIAMLSQYSIHHPPKIVWGRTVFPDSITSADLVCQYPDDPHYIQSGQYTSIVIGDFNGDGDNDLIFPDQGTSVAENGTGWAYGGRAIMYFGGSNMDGIPDMVLSFNGDYDYEPFFISETDSMVLRWFGPFMDKGDFNGDGYEDIFSGAYYSTTSITLISVVSGMEQEVWNSGAGVVFLGGPDFDELPDIIMLPSNDFLQFSTAVDFMYCGYWVFNAGDVDGNGTDDFSLPSWYWAVNFVYTGSRGYMQAPTRFQTRILREPAFYYTKDRYNSLGYSDQNGTNLLSIGDVNGDGTPDLGNTKNYYGNGPLDPGIRLFFITPEHSDAINWDYETADYIQIHQSNKDFDGDGVADIVANAANDKLTLLKVVIGDVYVDNDNFNKPSRFSLSQNFPNPFNPTTQIRYEIPTASHVTLNIYNVRGELVETLIDENQEQGINSILFDASNYPCGVYFYQITVGSNSDTKKLILIK
ncbi:T9SS type A sorting domain-containing protein [candidate division KSB1 bacterium]|nr:T9SS type A sorting domain-containing protein [candidate division KSB1 bacterium]